MKASHSPQITPLRLSPASQLAYDFIARFKIHPDLEVDIHTWLRTQIELLFSFKCKALIQGSAGGNDPADCGWPTCGCDIYANKVLAAMQESNPKFDDDYKKGFETGYKRGIQAAAATQCRWCREKVKAKFELGHLIHYFPDGDTSICLARQINELIPPGPNADDLPPFD